MRKRMPGRQSWEYRHNEWKNESEEGRLLLSEQFPLDRRNGLW